MDYAENTKLQQVYRSSHIPLFHQKLGKSQQGMDDYEQTDSEHRLIVKALKEKKLLLAEQTLVKHFTRGEAVVLEMD